MNPGKRAIYFGLQAAYQSQAYSITQLAKQYGIARSTVYRVMKRIKEEK
ncbi:helix-turn-helix domain-containing protein [Oenococcus kitaharae]|nr:helix-turn-helix domain-containing protein [Oenococcus kitaharae]